MATHRIATAVAATLSAGTLVDVLREGAAAARLEQRVARTAEVGDAVVALATAG